MKCEFCGKEHDGEEVVVNYYVHEEEHVHLSCLTCAQGLGEKRIIDLPDGWSIADSKVLDEVIKGNAAFLEARNVMSESVSVWNIPAGYVYDLAAYYKRIQTYFENAIKRQESFKHKLGLDGAIPEALLSGAYCPACKSPLIKMVGLKQRHALKCASSDLVNVMKPTRKKRNREVLACLQCCTAYIGGK